MNIREKLFALRQEVKPMKKDQKGYNYHYFDINQMIAVLQPLLVKYKLLISQPLVTVCGKMALETSIADVESPESISTTTPLIELQDPQKMGGCITYFRRYALQSLFFLEAEDDDAVEATQSVKTYPRYIPKQKLSPEENERYGARKSQPIVNSNEEIPFK